MTERRRVAAVIEHDGRVLMVRERARTAEGRHDGPEYWTLPGGGVERDEAEPAAVIREVREEVGLDVTETVEVARLPFPSGLTAVFRVLVAPGEPVLGVDDLPCPCPRMVGLDWVPRPALTPQHGGHPVPLLLYSL